jgi:ankyrin repeat protein
LKDENGHTPIYYAASNGRLEIVQLLMMDYNVPVLYDGDFKNSPFAAAVDNGHLEIVQILWPRQFFSENRYEEILGGKCWPKYDQAIYTSPLFEAAERGYYEIVSFLVDTNKFLLEDPNSEVVTLGN